MIYGISRPLYDHKSPILENTHLHFHLPSSKVNSCLELAARWAKDASKSPDRAAWGPPESGKSKIFTEISWISMISVIMTSEYPKYDRKWWYLWQVAADAKFILCKYQPVETCSNQWQVGKKKQLFCEQRWFKFNQSNSYNPDQTLRVPQTSFWPSGIQTVMPHHKFDNWN